MTNQLDSKKIKPLEYYLVAPVRWSKRSLQNILNTERFLAYYDRDETSLEYLSQYSLLSSLKKPVLYVNNSQSIIKMVELELGFGLLAVEIAQPLIDGKKIITLNSGKTFKVPLALAWFRRDQLPDYFKEVVSLIC